MTKKELAKKLDISTRQLRKLASKGMPTKSLKAAELWRSARLEIRQTKPVRMCGNNGGKKPKSGAKKRNPKAEPKTPSKMALEAEVTEQPLDPNEIFLYQALEDSMVLICAALIGEMGMSFKNASIVFSTICCCIGEIQKIKGFNSPLCLIPDPTDKIMPAEWRNQVKTEIKQKARELKLLADEFV